MSAARRPVWLGLAALLCGGTAAAQESRCTVGGANARQTVVTLPSGQRNTYWGGRPVANCPSRSITLVSDSLETYGDDGRYIFLGRVDYKEPRLALTSDYLTYYQQDERVLAQGNVHATLPSGSTLVGPNAEYFRAVAGTRPASRLVANGRPTITLVQKPDSLGNPSPPTKVLANRVTMFGDSLVYAGGQVEVTREDIVARGDSMHLDGEREYVHLMRNPIIEGRRGDRPYTLQGARIELLSSQRKLKRILATGGGRAFTDDMSLASDTIDLRIENDLLQRAIAWGPPPFRAQGMSGTQKLVSDSIDILMPNQRVLEMHAVRMARAEGRPDTTRFRADTSDWMHGDTIVAKFDTTATDSTRAARVREIVAHGNAKSFYHLPPADSSVRRPAINYVTGRDIIVSMLDQRVSKVTVVEKAAGVYLEPKPPPAAAKPDSAAAARPATGTPNPRPPR